jgi:uncharacterized membrane protein
MREVSSSIEINAPASLVWNVLADVEHWPSWTPTITSVTKLTPGPLVVGMAARILQPKLPPAVWQVTEIHAGRDFTWVNSRPGVRVIAAHVVEATPNGCRLTVSIRFAGFLGPLVGMFVRKLNEEYLATETKGMKQYVEALPKARAE